MDVTTLKSRGVLVPRPGVDLVDEAAEPAPLHDPDDPPIFLLQAASTFAGGNLPDGCWQRVPIGGAGQVLGVDPGGTFVEWINNPAGFTNPMLLLGDIITGGALGVATRLPIGGPGQVLTVSGGVPVWANSSSGFANPMTTDGDMILGNFMGLPGRLPIGTTGQVLTVSVGGSPTWENAASGFTNPMTTLGDVIVATTGGTATRLGIGSTGQVLTVSGGTATWANNAAGFTNPMTTIGDLITGGTGGAAQRLGAGATGQVLAISGGVPTWTNNPAGFTNPMTTTGDLIVGGTGGAAQRLGAGGTSTVLRVNGGTAHWLQDRFNVNDFGADPTGATFSDTAIAAAIAAMPLSGSPGAGGTLYFPAGTYKTNNTIAFTAVAPVYIVGEGPQATQINYYGNGDAISVYQNYVPSGGSSGIKVWGSGVEGLTIDGTNAGGSANGLHIGDMKYAKVRAVQIQNFGGVGLWQDNRAFWTEDCLFECHVLNCLTGCLIDVNGGNSVHDNCTFEISLAGPAGGNGVILQNGSNAYNSRFYIHGGITSQASASPQNYFLNLIGTSPAASMNGTVVVMQVESDGGLANGPGLINIANAGNQMGACSGHLAYHPTSGTTPAASVLTGKFVFNGTISVNDSVLTTQQHPSGFPGYGTQTTNNNPPCLMNVSGGTVTAILVNGVTTGATSGLVPLPAGCTYQINGSGSNPTLTFTQQSPS